MNETYQAQPGDVEQSAPVTQDGAVRFAVVIPAYRPQESLLDLIAALSEKSIPAIVVVDDGSGPAYREIFRRAAEFPKVRAARHAVNLGKGAALKTGFNLALCAFPGLEGVITADADGQHHPEDIERVAGQLAAEPDRVILGTRTFGGDVPLRSRFGNLATRTVMRALVGQQVSDTQTGLRGIPAALLPHLMRMETNGYDFELDMLIAVRQRALRITEVPIRTIYEPGNRTSHFNPLIDSMKIYFVLLRFSSVSLMTAALDSLVFYLAYRRLGNIAASQAIGRVLAVAFNYTMVRRAVFFSRHRHLSTLPKYLLLVCLSGSASYAGIQLLYSRFHVQPLPAKLFVETLLFFANFAIQRDFIFGSRPVEDGRKDTTTVKLVALTAVAIALLGVVIYGFRTAPLPHLGGWTQTGVHRLAHYSAAYWTVSLGLVLAAPWAFASVVAALIVAATAAAIGPAALLAAVGFLIASCSLGSRLLGKTEDSGGQLRATLVGVAVYIFLMTFLARLPVNYPAVYLALLAIPVLLDLRGTRRRLTQWGRALVRYRPGRLEAAAFALLVFVLGMHWLIVPQPEASADGLAMHLAIPADIARHHLLTYRPDRILWSVMPMGADWCYSIVYLLGGEFAARLLNFAMLLVVVALLYRAVRRFVTPAPAYVIVALFASTSLVQLVTGSLMVENFLAAMVIGSLMATWRFGETGARRDLYAAAVLGGTALAIKLGGLAYLAVAAPLIAIEIRRHWRKLGRRPMIACGIAAGMLLAAALPAYVISWRMTGDPLFPFLNQKFPSPVLDHAAVIKDLRFNQPLTFHTAFDLTFHSGRYYEGQSGSLGFQDLLLVPLGLIALVFVRRRQAVSAGAVSLIGALIVLEVLPNARYLYPSLPLLLVPVAALFGWLAGNWLRRGLIALAVGCVALNIWFLPSSNYLHGDFYERSPLSRAMREVFIHKCAPIREIAEYMNREHPGSAVFLADGSAVAPFHAEVYATGWHQYKVWASLQRARSPQDAARLFRQWKVRYIESPKPAFGVSLAPPVLEKLLDECTTPEFQTSWLYLARLENACGPAVRDRRAPLLVSPGFYDDFDPSIAFHGPWIRDQEFAQPFAHTLTYSNSPGSEARFAFQGSLLIYYYTKASNRGLADVTIDGVHRASVDLYAAKTEWQSRTVFRDLGTGKHLAVVSVLPGRNPASSDGFVDVDGFEALAYGAVPVRSSSIWSYAPWIVLFAWLGFVTRTAIVSRSRASVERAGRILAYGAGLALFAWFLYLVWGGLASWFDADDLMNLYTYWSRPWSALLKANVFFWSSYYRPGGGLFYRAIYALWGFHPLPYHIAALILLSLDFALLAIVVHQLTGSRWSALVALLLVGIHPTFSAAYFDTGTIYDVLAYLFFWAGFALYVRIRRAGRWPGWRGAAVLLCLFVAALNSKEIAVTLPVAIGLYELVWHPPSKWRLAEMLRWIRQEGRLALIGGLMDIAYIIGKRFGPNSLWEVKAYQPHYSVAAYFRSLSHYLHELLYTPAANWQQMTVLLAAMVILAAVSRRRCLIWGIAFILTGVLPLAFIPGRAGFAYLVPSVGWAVYAGGLLDWLLEALSFKRLWLQRAAQALVLIALFAGLARWQRQWISMHSTAAHDMQARFHNYADQIHALIPNPRKGARILLLSDAGGYNDWDVYFLIQLFYGDPSLKVDRLSICRERNIAVNPASYNYVLDWKDNRFVLVAASGTG